MDTIRNTLLILVSLTISVVLIEAGLRIMNVSDHHRFMATNPQRGWAFQPGAEGWWRTEGEAYVRINKAGQRDREHEFEKASDTVRIAVLGDSYAAALQVPLKETFWSVMGDKLSTCPRVEDRRIEVLNFGVPGYNTAQELLTFRHVAERYDPDIVLLAVFTGNDISGNLRSLSGDSQSPYFELDGEDLQLDLSFLSTIRYKIRDSWGFEIVSSLHLYHVLTKAQTLFETFVRAAAQPESAGASEVGLDDLIYRVPESKDWREAWRVTEALIQRMQREVMEKDAQFVVVTLSNAIQVHPATRVREEYAKFLGVDDLLYPDLRIKAYGEANNINVLNLAHVLQQYAEGRHVYLHGFENFAIGRGHWNSTGHMLAGRLIAEHLCREILPMLEPSPAEPGAIVNRGDRV